MVKKNYKPKNSKKKQKRKIGGKNKVMKGKSKLPATHMGAKSAKKTVPEMAAAKGAAAKNTAQNAALGTAHAVGKGAGMVAAGGAAVKDTVVAGGAAVKDTVVAGGAAVKNAAENAALGTAHAAGKGVGLVAAGGAAVKNTVGSAAHKVKTTVQNAATNTKDAVTGAAAAVKDETKKGYHSGAD